MNYELYEKLTRLQWLLHKQQIRGHADIGPMADTTRGQGRILAVLKLRDGISTKDLSYLLGVRVSSLNELLLKLEKSGHIKREPSEDDKRVMLVRLTEKGKSVEEPDVSDINDIFACLSDEEQEAFGAYLDRVIASLSEKLGYDDEEEFDRMRAAREHFAEMVGGHFDDFRGILGGFGRFGRGGRDLRHDHDYEGFGRSGRGRHHDHD